MKKHFNYAYLKRKPQVFHRLTGLKVSDFDEIAKRCAPLWKKKVILVKKVSGRPYALGGLEDHLLCLLIYYRCYVTHAFLGCLWGSDDSIICRSFKRIESILAQVVAIKKDRTMTAEELETLIIDCTEQPIERPKKKQRDYYSGKKKRHTLKTEIYITEERKIVNLSKSHPGSVHDYEVRKQSPPLPRHSRSYVDSGYQGLQNVHPATELPYKKPKNGELEPDEKQYNQALSRFRVRVENKICELKVFRILSDRYRNKRKGYGLKINTIAGLVNFKNGF